MKRKKINKMTPEQVIERHVNGDPIYDDFLEHATTEEVLATLLITTNMIEEMTMKLVVSLLKTLPHCQDEATVDEAQRNCYNISNILTTTSRLTGPLLAMQACKYIKPDLHMSAVSPEELGAWAERNYKNLLAKRKGVDHNVRV